MNTCQERYSGKPKCKCGKPCRGVRCARHQRQRIAKETRRKAEAFDRIVAMTKDATSSDKFIVETLIADSKAIAARKVNP